MMDDWIDRIMAVFFGVCALGLLVLVLFGIYMGGWSLGLYSVSCRMESSQPKCVKAGWGTHNDVKLRTDQPTKRNR